MCDNLQFIILQSNTFTKFAHRDRYKIYQLPSAKFDKIIDSTHNCNVYYYPDNYEPPCA
jgi:hypothetical protein